jgi:nucleotide-binding universal stress UspA family protein
VRSMHSKRTVLVPIFGADVSEETVAVASSLLARADSRLVLLHVTPAGQDAGGSVPRRGSEGEPRWRRLATTAAPGRTFVEAVAGDPATEVLAEAERFRSDAIVLGPSAPGLPNAWIDRAIARVVGAAPRRVYLANQRAPGSRPTSPAHPRAPRPFHQRRSHVAQS